jgi:hypothetical protein
MATYDRLDWHYDSAIAAGRPPENAFTHMGFPTCRDSRSTR